MGNRPKSVGEEVGQIIKKNISRLTFFIGRGINYYCAGHIYIPKPVIFTLGITRRCNSKCIMCSIWKGEPKGELSLGEIQEIFTNPLLNRLETVILSGGEPTLREDMAQIVQVILDSNPRIRQMWFITNGLEPSLVGQRVKDILHLPAYSQLEKFAIEVSLDGYGDTHERIRRVPQAFDRVNETLKILKGLQLNSPFGIQLNCVVQKLNVGNLLRLSQFAQEMELPITFGPVVKILGNVKDFKEHLMPSEDQLKELKNFFSHQIENNIKLPTVVFWQDYFRIIRGEKRRTPCALLYHSLIMDAEGNLFVCGNESLVYGNVHNSAIDKIWYSQEVKRLRKKAKKYICPRCATSCNTTFSLRYEFFYFTWLLLKIALRKPFCRTKISNPLRSDEPPP